MLFSSITFLFIFLPLTLLLYYLVPFRMKNYVMLAASLIFYAWGEPVYIILMILSIILNYFCGQDIYEKRDNARAMKMSLMFGVVMNLLILGFFKYYGLLMEYNQCNFANRYSVSCAGFANRNFILYIPGNVLFDRCISKRGKTTGKCFIFRIVYFNVSAVDRRTDRPLY